jgi:hypothetical protein
VISLTRRVFESSTVAIRSGIHKFGSKGSGGVHENLEFSMLPALTFEMDHELITSWVAGVTGRARPSLLLVRQTAETRTS